ncbi:helix-turn-helix transcriptional regulator [Brachybacterium paraconglomeratum]|uniref:helix-turn-helix transcriptional regulator n=1 Tax=Brachybacterium paraconglomeratum TaxID=173362 RepID=UPI003FD28BCC
MSTKLLTIPEVAELLGKSTRSVEWMVYAKTGPRSAKIGGRRMFRESDVEAWINAQFEAAEQVSA